MNDDAKYGGDEWWSGGPQRSIGKGSAGEEEWLGCRAMTNAESDEGPGRRRGRDEADANAG